MTSVPTERRSPDDGLQPERTALSWSRTSLGFLANGALLLLRDAGHHTGPLRTLPAVLALVCAVAVWALGRRRLYVLRRRPLPSPLAARRSTVTVGSLMIVLTLTTAVLFLA